MVHASLKMHSVINRCLADMPAFHGLLPSSYIWFCTNKWLNWEKKYDYFFMSFRFQMKKLKLLLGTRPFKKTSKSLWSETFALVYVKKLWRKIMDSNQFLFFVLLDP